LSTFPPSLLLAYVFLPILLEESFSRRTALEGFALKLLFSLRLINAFDIMIDDFRL